MKPTIYHMTLSDGTRVDVSAQNAGEAIESARRKYRGNVVVECYSGLTEEDARVARSTRDKKAIAGRVVHDIPPHGPIAEDEVVARRHRRTDASIAMFDDGAIAQESRMAKARFEHPAR